MSKEEAIKQARIDLAAALRWAARLGFSEGVCNHFSAAVPGETGVFLINPQGLHWSEVHPRDIVMVDLSGKVLEGAHTVEPTAFSIHAAIHGARKRNVCV